MSPLPDFPAVLEIRRPMSYFGSKLELRRCTAFQFMPDVWYFVATGQQLARDLERKSYGFFRAMLALQRASESGSVPRRGTLDELAPFFQEALVMELPVTYTALEGVPLWRRPPYRAIFTSRKIRSRVDRRVIVRLAAEMRLAFTLDGNVGYAGHPGHYSDVFGRSILEWHAHLSRDAAIHLDRLLMHLAWTDRDLCEFSEEGRPADQTLPLVSLADPTQRPMRHWFDGLLEQTRCADLPDFERLLLRRGLVVPHQTLRHWASSTQPLQHRRAMEILRAAAPRVDYERERRRFWCARLLTFAQELLRAAAETPLGDELARHLVYRRLVKLRGG